MTALPILFHDDHLVAVNKTSGLLVHRTEWAREASEFALQTVRDQIGRHVFPVHRLDRATSGALVFALSREAARGLCTDFEEGRVEKTYVAVVRGHPPDEWDVDHALDGKASRTRFRTLATRELDVAVDRYPTARYALVEARPETGRTHQIRRHLSHVHHPIVGDVRYGKGKHNRFFREYFGAHRLLLACRALAFRHPATGRPVEIQAPLAPELVRLLEQLGWARYI